ncbi:MAG: hypothetical protein WCO13_05645 [Bacteroidota bacterium]
MKKIILLIALSAIIISCSESSDKKAQRAIKDYLQKNLNDAKSYESVDFGKLISDSTKFDDDLYNSGIKFSESNFEFFSSVYNESQNPDDKIRMTEAEKEVIEKKKEYEQAKSNFKSELIYKMTHKYRAKNKFGAIVLEETLFVIDKDFKKAKKY